MDFANNTVREGSRILSRWLRHGSGDVEQFSRHGLTVVGELLQVRAMQSAGSSAVNTAFFDGFYSTLDQLNTVRRVATVIQTDSGEPLTIPTTSDDESAVLLWENADMLITEVAVDNFTIGSHKYTSKIVRISHELLADATPSFDRQLGKVLGNRIARLSNLHFTVGDGVSKPEGIVTGSTLGHTAAATITYDDLIELQHSVDAALWPTSGFMMSTDTFKVVRKLEDGNGNLAYQGGKLLDMPVHLNPAMPAAAADAKPVLCGDFSQYLIREAGSLAVRRYGERFAEWHQTGVAAILRSDGKLAVPTAVRHLLMA